MTEPTVDYEPIAAPVNGASSATAWVELKRRLRDHLAALLLGSPEVKALLEAAAEAAGAELDGLGPALAVTLEISAARVRYRPLTAEERAQIGGGR